MFQKILVAVDGSDGGQLALERAMALAKGMNAQLKLLMVQAPPEANYPNKTFPINSTYPGVAAESLRVQLEVWEAKEQQTEQYLQTLVETAIAQGIATEATQLFGHPGRTICELATDWQASVIVMGRRGYTGIGEWFMGSVSNYVMHHAPCSVLTVQTQVTAA